MKSSGRASFPAATSGHAPSLPGRNIRARITGNYTNREFLGETSWVRMLSWILMGVDIYARRADDLFFVEEVYFSNTYNICTVDDICAIDIGMNVGLATLYLARKPERQRSALLQALSETFERGVSRISR